jgi:hypothetical protein
VFLYDPANGYSTFIAVAAGWAGGVAPSPAVGQGFFYYTANAAGVSWTRTFNVN